MCGRFSLAKEKEYLERRFGVSIMPGELLKPRYNIAPSSDVPAIVFTGGRRRLEVMKWGIYRQWNKDKPPLFITNLRAEKLEKGAFKPALAKRRCLIPADGFYEWKAERGKKFPYRFTMKDGEAFAFAAIYDEPTEEQGAPLRTFTIFTTSPNELVRDTHDRMPCILPRHMEGVWLDTDLDDAHRAIAMLTSYPADRMNGYEISTAINSARKDSPDLIAPMRTDFRSRN